MLLVISFCTDSINTRGNSNPPSPPSKSPHFPLAATALHTKGNRTGPILSTCTACSHGYRLATSCHVTNLTHGVLLQLALCCWYFVSILLSLFEFPDGPPPPPPPPGRLLITYLHTLNMDPLLVCQYCILTHSQLRLSGSLILHTTHTLSTQTLWYSGSLTILHTTHTLSTQDSLVVVQW